MGTPQGSEEREEKFSMDERKQEASFNSDGSWRSSRLITSGS